MFFCPKYKAVESPEAYLWLSFAKPELGQRIVPDWVSLWSLWQRQDEINPQRTRLKNMLTHLLWSLEWWSLWPIAQKTAGRMLSLYWTKKWPFSNLSRKQSLKPDQSIHWSLCLLNTWQQDLIWGQVIFMLTWRTISQPLPRFKVDTVLIEQYCITIQPRNLSSALSNMLVPSNVSPSWADYLSHPTIWAGPYLWQDLCVLVGYVSCQVVLAFDWNL